MKHTTWLLAGGLALFVACGGGGGGNTSGNGGAGTGGSGAVTAEQACEQLAGAQCDALERCSTKDLLSAYAGDKALCVSRNKAVCVGSLKLSGVTVTLAALTACAAAEKALACPGYFDPAPPAACDFRGSKENGSACALGMECKSGVCLSIGASGCGLCVAQPTEGDSCGAESGCGRLPCADDGTCTQYGLLGAECDDTYFPCNPAYYCDPGTDQCTEWSAAGASCQFAYCDALAALDCSESETCVPGATTDEEGADCLSAFCKGTYCNGLFKCHAWTPDDGDCGIPCQPPATCQSGKCRLAPATCQ